MVRQFALVSVLVLGLAACQTGGPKQGAGTLLGGITGAVAGSQFGSGDGRVAMAAAGALLGALIGSEIGASLDRADRLAMDQATQTALETEPSGTQVGWSNPDSGNFGTIVPEPAFKDTTGRYCREFQQSITVGGKSESGYGTACRQPDGSWQIVN